MPEETSIIQRHIVLPETSTPTPLIVSVEQSLSPFENER
jgi:hypothetical protein